MFFRREPLSRVSQLYLNGTIGTSFTYNTVKRSVEEAFDQQNLKAVCIIINSPGGSPVQSQLIADYYIRYHGETRKIPVYAFIEDISASGGYLIACAADLIYVSRFSLVGSIGAVMTTFSAVPLLEKIGIEPKIFTAGCRKAGPNPMVQMSEEEEEDINNLLKYTHKVNI